MSFEYIAQQGRSRTFSTMGWHLVEKRIRVPRQQIPLRGGLSRPRSRVQKQLASVKNHGCSLVQEKEKRQAT
jgi:hypothetical protein